MKKFSLFTTLIFLLIVAHSGFGQSISRSVVGATGSFSSSANASLSATTGEVMVETFASSSNFLTQGFQQPTAADSTSDTSDAIKEQLNADKVQIYPNPVVHDLTVAFTINSSKDYQVELLDVLGQVVASPNAMSGSKKRQVYRINMYSLPSGMYFIRITSTDRSEQKVFKINKVE